MPGLKERAKTLIELLDSAYYLMPQRPLALDEKAAALLNAEARAPARRDPAGAGSPARVERRRDGSGGAAFRGGPG